MFIQGSYLDGKTSKRHDGRLELLDDQSIKIFGTNIQPEIVHASFDDLKIESRLANTPREIVFGQGQLFITDDNDAVDELIRRCKGGNSTSFLHRWESNITLIVAASIATFGLIWVMAVYGIPKSAELIAHQLPDFATEQIGSSLTLLDKTVFSPTELKASRQEEIHALAAPFLSAFPELKPKLQFRSGMDANAFALPNGEIVFTDDFVNMVEDDQELVAVLLHEIGHLKHKHILRRALQDSMITLFVLFIVGDLDAIDLVAGLPTLILDLSYSKEFEREADKFALEQMYRFGVPVDHFATVMQHLALASAGDEKELDVTENNKRITNFLSTHPPTNERVQLVEIFKREHGITD